MNIVNSDLIIVLDIYCYDRNYVSSYSDADTEKINNNIKAAYEVFQNDCKMMDEIFVKEFNEEKIDWEIGEDFGIVYYDEDFSLVSFLDEKTDDLGLLLDTGAPEYVIEEYKKIVGSKLERKYNCCVMFYEMNYTGKISGEDSSVLILGME